MRISILSDFHFGYAPCAELEADSFENAEKVMSKALDSDLILVAGDIFDSRIPKTDVWARAIRILVKPLLRTSQAKFIECSKELRDISKRTLQALPVIALHGTHERRGRDEVNAIQVLERAGLLIHLHRTTIVFEKDGKRVAIYGMSGVPDRYAHRMLIDWNPQPIQDCFNILMLHQSVEPFVWSPTEAVSLNLSNLPRGFDLIVDGHVHQHAMERVNGSTLLIPGSTLITQLERPEAEDVKGLYQVELTESGVKIEFVPIRTRKFFYEEVAVRGSVGEAIKQRLGPILAQEFEKKPLVKLRVIGKEVEVSEHELREIEKRYGDKLILLLTTELEAPEITRKIKFLRALREKKLSIEEIGFHLLKKNLDELNFGFPVEYERLFRLLCERKPEEVLNLLTGEQRTLEGVEEGGAKG